MSHQALEAILEGKDWKTYIKLTANLDRFLEIKKSIEQDLEFVRARIDKYKSELRQLNETSDSALELAEQAHIADILAQGKEIKLKAAQRLEKYNKVKEDLIDWEAPEYCQEIKQWAIQEISTKIVWDCDTSFIDKWNFGKSNAIEIRQRREKDIKEMIEYYQKDEQKSLDKLKKETAIYEYMKAL